MKIVFFDVAPTETEAVRAAFPEATVIADPLSAETAHQAADAEVVSIFVSSVADKAALDQLKKLRHIGCRSTGFDHVDLEAARARNISISTVPSYGENTVAEYAFTLLLALSRKLTASIDQIHEGEIDHTATMGFDLMGKTLGVIGTGRIGTHSISIGNGFGMKVLGFDPFPRLELEGQLGFHYVDLAELLKEADVITLHAPLTPDTKHLLDAAAFRRMKKSAVVINTSRGELIDTAALTEALEKKMIAGAALDVIEGEKLLDLEEELHLLVHSRSRQKLELAAEITVLEKMSNVIITPHNAFNTREAVDRIWKTSFDNIQNFIGGKPTNLIPVK